MDNKQPSGGNIANPSVSTRSTSTSAMSPTPQSTTQTVQFDTKNIGQWQSKQQGFFAEQNRAQEDENRAKAVKRRKTRKILLVGGGSIICSHRSCDSSSNSKY